MHTNIFLSPTMHRGCLTRTRCSQDHTQSTCVGSLCAQLLRSSSVNCIYPRLSKSPSNLHASSREEDRTHSRGSRPMVTTRFPVGAKDTRSKHLYAYQPMENKAARPLPLAWAARCVEGTRLVNPLAVLKSAQFWAMGGGSKTSLGRRCEKS